MELFPKKTNINCKFFLDKDEVNCALNCMNNLIKCHQQSPVLYSEERNRHIKECQELVIKCYLQILQKKK
jgi:hypothetical protein